MTNSFANQANARELLLKQLSCAPKVTLSGLVSPTGLAAGRSIDEPWSILITFDAWRIEGKAMRLEPLTARRIVEEAEIQQYQKAIPAKSIIKFSARLAIENSSNKPQALFLDLIDNSVIDTDLQEHLNLLDQPIIKYDDQLGTFHYSREYHHFESKTQWRSEPIKLTLSVENASEYDQALGQARTLWTHMADWDNRVKQAALDELFTLKNEDWRDEDEPEVTRTEFLDRMTLETIDVWPDGNFTFWYHDGGLFAGHAIDVDGSLHEGVRHAGITG